MDILKDFLINLPLTGRIVAFVTGMIVWGWFLFLYPGLKDKSIKAQPKANIETKKDIGSTGFKISGNKNVLKGNIAIGNEVGFDIGGENNLLEDNLSVGINEAKQDISQIEKILDKNLQNLQQNINNKSNFDRASLYDVAARKYAVYGIWEKSFDNAYKAVSLYLKVSQDDSSEIYQLIFSNYHDQFKKDCISGIVMHLNFVANTVRKEQGKNYSYFLQQLLIRAEKDNNIEANNFLKELIKEQAK